MAQSVIKNAADKVIRNVSGNILKQNFQFGKYFHGGTVNAYLRLVNVAGVVEIGQPFTITCWKPHNVDGILAGQDGTIAIVDTSGNVALGFYTQASGTNFIGAVGGQFATAGSPTSTLFINGADNPAGKAFFCITHNGANSLVARRNTSNNNFETFTFTTPIANIYFGSTQALGQIFTDGIDEICIFNRVISDAERKYIHNNRLGNEPASVEGLKGRYTMNVAEELDFSAAQDGSDLRAGFRDMSGNNNHLDFINVPAGTNAQRIAYVNNNLLTLW